MRAEKWNRLEQLAAAVRFVQEHLIENFDDYNAPGVNTVSVYYMGSSSAYADPFTPDDNAIEAGHQRRMEQIIAACDRRGWS